MRDAFGFAKRLFAILTLVIAATACLSPSLAQDAPMVLPVDPASLTADTVEGRQTFAIEIADDPEERSRGLMFRTRMAENHGMLFIFEQTRPLGFWMKNTPLPLDLVFIGEDGRVVDVLRGEPFSTDPISPGQPARFVLELNAGIAQKTGIVTGVRIRHPAIDNVAGDG
ncbi:DUF192 domain-containing protein [Mesorhizobium xinjiangense]|uniref:DUF192 domain-containing protein n=1 Tax=Mesorhizobium xinjiangense TaxID=2678685 RepID=UPI0012EE2FA4|nr:DUF192 domain-containing protein [Mesorhizobium xinjiangense]